MPESNPTSIQTVVCAIDFSESSEIALDHATSLATQHDARLVLAHVVEPIPLGSYPSVSATETELAVHDMVVERVREVVERLRGEGVVVDSRVATGSPGSLLIEIAGDEGADVLVVGTRGLTGFEHILLGSTAEYVVRCSPCPVLTIHPEDRIELDSMQTVIVPTNLSAETTKAVDTLVRLLSERVRPRVILTFADRTPPYLAPFRHDTLLKMNQRDVVKEEIERKMSTTVEHLRNSGFEVETAVLDGDPVSVVTELAREREADLIVMTTQGRIAPVNAILGKTAQRIVQHAPCPVLSVRP